MGRQEHFAGDEQGMSEARAPKNANRDVKVVEMTAVSVSDTNSPRCQHVSSEVLVK
jgi:hypothetical protein